MIICVFQSMNFFLSLTGDGKQLFLTQEGTCSGLLKDAPVYTHHSALSSGYTMKATDIVRVNRLPVGAMLSDPTISKMIFADGDEAIRAQLGYLDSEVAPVDPELAVVIEFGKGKIKKHSFLVGGKPRDVMVPLANLEGLCIGIDTSSHIALGLDFTAIQFAQGKKATEWRKLDEMFKDAAFCKEDFSKTNLYTRWRVLESAGEGEEREKLKLVLEALPLEKALDDCDAEMIVRYKSSSNKPSRCIQSTLNGEVRIKSYKCLLCHALC